MEGVQEMWGKVGGERMTRVEERSQWRMPVMMTTPWMLATVALVEASEHSHMSGIGS